MKCDDCKWKDVCFIESNEQIKNCKAYKKAKQPTNGDKIRSMSDEELDIFLRNVKNRARIIALSKKPELLKELVDLEWIKQIAE